MNLSERTIKRKHLMRLKKVVVKHHGSRWLLRSRVRVR